MHQGPVFTSQGSKKQWKEDGESAQRERRLQAQHGIKHVRNELVIRRPNLFKMPLQHVAGGDAQHGKQHQRCHTFTQGRPGRTAQALHEKPKTSAHRQQRKDVMQRNGNTEGPTGKGIEDHGVAVMGSNVGN